MTTSTSIYNSLTPSSTALASATLASASTSAGNPKSNAGAIAGGVVGGIGFVAVVGLGSLWFFLRRKRNKVQQNIAFDRRALVSGTGMSQNTGTTQGILPSQQSIYVRRHLNIYLRKSNLNEILLDFRHAFNFIPWNFFYYTWCFEVFGKWNPKSLSIWPWTSIRCQCFAWVYGSAGNLINVPSLLTISYLPVDDFKLLSWHGARPHALLQISQSFINFITYPTTFIPGVAQWSWLQVS